MTATEIDARREAFAMLATLATDTAPTAPAWLADDARVTARVDHYLATLASNR